MWFFLITVALVVFIWVSEPKSEILPAKCCEMAHSLPENESGPGGISRLLDR